MMDEERLAKFRSKVVSEFAFLREKYDRVLIFVKDPEQLSNEDQTRLHIIVDVKTSVGLPRPQPMMIHDNGDRIYRWQIEVRLDNTEEGMSDRKIHFRVQEAEMAMRDALLHDLDPHLKAA